MKKKIVIISSLIGIIIIIGLVYNFIIKREKGIMDIASTVSKKGEFLIVVSEIGKLDAAKSVNVTSNNQGKIVKMISEGTVVKKGDPIVWLDTTDIEKQIKDAEASLKSEEANYQKTDENERLSLYSNDMNVKSAKSQLANAQAELESAKTKLARTQRLFEADLTPETSLEDAKLTVLGAELSVENAEISLAKAEETRKSGEVSTKLDLQTATSNVEEAKRKLNELRDRLKDATITAPNDGIVVYSSTWRGSDFGKVQEGDQVWPRMTIMSIPDLSNMICTAQVDEIDISRVQVGQDVIIRVDAIPDAKLAGRVSRIATLAVDKGAGDAPIWMRREASGVKVFDVVSDVDPASLTADLRPGMTTKIDMVIQRFENVITVPLESVFEYQAQKVVYVLKSKTPERKEVVLGKSDGNFVVIEKGVNAGERVCLRDPTKELKESASKKIEPKSGPPEINSPPGMGSAPASGSSMPAERRPGGGGRER